MKLLARFAIGALALAIGGAHAQSSIQPAGSPLLVPPTARQAAIPGMVPVQQVETPAPQSSAVTGATATPQGETSPKPARKPQPKPPKPQADQAEVELIPVSQTATKGHVPIDLSRLPAPKARVPQLEMPLPGLGSLPGAKKMPSKNIVRFDGEMAEVAVSQDFPNRIVTPFAKPRAVDASGAEITVDGNSLYIRPANAAPLAIYVTGDKPGDPVASLLLRPMDTVPPQTIVLQTDQKAAKGAAGDEPGADTYVGRIVDTFRKIALGGIPAGYSNAELPVSIARLGDLLVKVERRLSGRESDIYVYQVENASTSIVELKEEMFNDEAMGVRAVGFYPNVVLAPRQATRVVVKTSAHAGGKLQ